MSYTTNGSRKFVPAKDLNLDPIEGTLTQDGYSRVVELDGETVARLVLDVTAVSDADTLDVTVECSRDGVNDWYSVGTFISTTAPGKQRRAVPLDRFVRAHFDVTGSDVSIAATLRGEAV